MATNSYETVLKDGVFTLSKPYKYGDGPERNVLDFPLKDMKGQHLRTAQRNYEMLEGPRSEEHTSELQSR